MGITTYTGGIRVKRTPTREEYERFGRSCFYDESFYSWDLREIGLKPKVFSGKNAEARAMEYFEHIEGIHETESTQCRHDFGKKKINDNPCPCCSAVWIRRENQIVTSWSDSVPDIVKIIMFSTRKRVEISVFPESTDIEHE